MLAELTAKLEGRVDSLSAAASDIFARPLTAESRRQAEHITFQLQTFWELHVRNFVLLSAAGVAADHSGPIASSVPFRYRTREAAGHYLISQYTHRTTEPDWYLPLEAINAATRLNIGNLAKFTAAMGSTPWILDELRHTRNFFAHKSKRSALKLRTLGWFQNGEEIKVETTISTFATGGVTRFEEWSAFVKAVANSML